MNPEDWFTRMRDDDRWTNSVGRVRAPRRRVITGIAIVALIVLCVVATLAIVPALRSMRTPVPASTTNAPVAFLQANGAPSGIAPIDSIDEKPLAVWGPGRQTILVVLYSLPGCPDTPTDLKIGASNSIRLVMRPLPQHIACRSGSGPSTITFAVPSGIDSTESVTVDVPRFGEHSNTLHLTVGGSDAIRPCTSADFTLGVDDLMADVPGGFDLRDLELTKTGMDSCELRGAPFLTMLNSSHVEIGRPAASAVWGESGGPMTMAPGDKAYVRLSIKLDTTYPASSCTSVTSSEVSVLVTGSLTADEALAAPLGDKICTDPGAKQLTASNYQPSPTIAIP